MSLRLRLTALYVLLLALTIAGFALVVYIIASQRIYQNLDDGLDARALVVAAALQPLNAAITTQDVAQRGPELDNAAAGGGIFQIRDPSGRLVYSSIQTSANSPLLRTNDVSRTSYATRKIGGQRLRVLNEPLRANDGTLIGTLQVADSASEVDEALDEIRYVFIIGGIGALFVTSIIAYVFAGRGLRPVRQVSRLAQDIERTADFSRRVPPTALRGEMQELVSTFNAMIGRVEQTLASQRSFLSDSSHELRRPLTVLRTNVDVLKNPQLSAEEREACLREMTEEASAMSRLISDLLLLSREVPQAIERTAVDYSNLCAETMNRVRSQDKQHEFTSDVPPGIRIYGDTNRLVQMVHNVLENAVQYTPPGGLVSLRLQQTNGVAELAIEDTGVGISAEEQAHVFERFYRGARARALRSEGNGLGLAIVKYIAEAHGGEVSMNARPGQGSAFVVRLPAYQ